MDITTLVTALMAHQWATATGGVLLLLVYLAHLPQVAELLNQAPKLVVALAPIVIGIISLEGQALVQGQPWLPALLAGVIAALPALIAVTTPFLLARKNAS